MPNSLVVTREYDYLTISKKTAKKSLNKQKFDLKNRKILEHKVEIKKVKIVESKKDTLYFDDDKIPAGAVWRTMQTGDLFTKFGGGTKKLNDYYINKKIPTRVRNTLPILAYENEILLILGVEISDKIKVDNNSKNIYSIKIVDW